MPKIDHDTKEKILAAAEKVFHANGFRGARTTLIAEEAGISRTMLHYYFSTKEALFQEVLNHTFHAVFGHLKRILTENKNLEELIGHLVEVVADVLEAKPGLPSFLINILNETPQLAMFMTAGQEDTIPALLDDLLRDAKRKGEVETDMNGEDLIINIYALCAIPYLAAPYIKAKEGRDEAAMQRFIHGRRSKIKTLILRGLR
jgi:TetR/AcrR family transcriptional regulator